MRILKSKKATDLGFFNWWPEYITLCFLFVGFVLSIFAKSAFVSYVIISLCGIITGRVFYKKRDDLKVPFFIMVGGFLIGYSAGASLRYGDVRIILALYTSTIILSNWLHKEGHIPE